MTEEQKRKIRVAWLSDSPTLTTGYSTISLNVCNRLADEGMEVFYFANNYIGQTLQPGIKLMDGTEFKFTMIGGGRMNYFQDLIEMKLKELQIDVFVILLDTFMLYPWLINLDMSPAKVIFYFPSDGGFGMPLGCEQILRKVDYPIAMAKFGQKQVEKMYNIKTDYIPHAVNVHDFYPVSPQEKEKIKEKWGLKDKFVVGTVARNQGRKMLDRTIKAFAAYSKLNPNAVLFLHTDPDDNAAVFPIRHLINMFGINNKVLFSGMRFYNSFTYKQMNEVYNLMDVFILTTSGEGFGIPIIEASACGIPTLVTDYTTTRELCIEHNCGMAIDLCETTFDENPDVHTNEVLNGTIMGSWSVERGICSIKDAVRKLQMLEDKKLRDELGRNGRLMVLENYTWEIVGDKFVDVITKLGKKY